jgi:hypothetical protein
MNAYEGDSYLDTVCLLNSSYCVKNFTFLAADVCMANVSLDGYVGISPDDPTNGPSFITALYDAGLVSDKVITIKLGPQDQAVVTFGGLDIHADNKSILYYGINTASKWQLNL